MTACAVSPLRSTETIIQINDFLTLINVTPRDNAQTILKTQKLLKKCITELKLNMRQ